MSDIRALAQILLQSQQPPPIERNAPYVKPGAAGFNTQLDPLNEMAFRQWAQQNNIPFNPNAATPDYDMRGFYQGIQQQNPRAFSGMNPNDGQIHFSDFWKTPYHESFSNESQWATPNAPAWNAQDQLIAPGGRITFDERKR